MNKLSGFIYVLFVMCMCLTMLFICLKASADTYEEVDDGIYQKIIPPSDNEQGQGVEYLPGENQTGEEENQQNEEEPEEEPEEATTEFENNDNVNSSDGQDQNTNVSSEEQIDLLTEIDNDIKKVIISIWTLFGLLLGTKIVKGLFGYGS